MRNELKSNYDNDNPTSLFKTFELQQSSFGVNEGNKINMKLQDI